MPAKRTIITQLNTKCLRVCETKYDALHQPENHRNAGIQTDENNRRERNDIIPTIQNNAVLLDVKCFRLPSASLTLSVIHTTSEVETLHPLQVEKGSFTRVTTDADTVT